MPRLEVVVAERRHMGCCYAGACYVVSNLEFVVYRDPANLLMRFSVNLVEPSFHRRGSFSCFFQPRWYLKNEFMLRVFSVV